MRSPSFDARSVLLALWVAVATAGDGAALELVTEPQVVETVRAGGVWPRQVPIFELGGNTLVRRTYERGTLAASRTAWRGHRYSGADPEFYRFVAPEDGVYVLLAGDGVYASAERLVGPGLVYSDVVPVAYLGVPRFYMWHAQARERWYTVMRRDVFATEAQEQSAKVRTAEYELALLAVGSMEPEGAVTGRVTASQPLQAYALEVERGAGYVLALDSSGQVDYDLFLLREASARAFRVARASCSKSLGTEQESEALLFRADAPGPYVALVALAAGDGEYRLTLRRARPGEDKRFVWREIADDDGEQDSYWGQVTSPASALYKVLVLDSDPSTISRARIAYRMGTQPYESSLKQYLGRGAPADAEWSHLLIYINDELVLDRPLPEVAAQGWHEVSIDPKLLLRGENVVRLTDSGNDYFYLAIDLDTVRARSYCSVRGEIRKDTLRPSKEVGPGEYMVRLKVQ